MNFDPLPDADNAAVGSHNDFFSETPERGCLFFILKVLDGNHE